MFITVRNEVAKVMFLHLSVILFMGGLPQCMLGYHPLPKQAPQPPREQAPPGSRHPPGRRHPLEQSPPLEQVTPLGAGTPPGAGTPSQQLATVADSTHPTGMHCCCTYCWLPLAYIGQIIAKKSIQRANILTFCVKMLVLMM